MYLTSGIGLDEVLNSQHEFYWKQQAWVIKISPVWTLSWVWPDSLGPGGVASVDWTLWSSDRSEAYLMGFLLWHQNN